MTKQVCLRILPCTSAISRAILKLVCQFGIQSADPPKIDKHHSSLSQSHKSDALSYSERMHNSQNFLHWGELTVPPQPHPSYTPTPHRSLDSSVTQWFFSLLSLSKNRHPHPPKKMLQTVLNAFYLRIFVSQFCRPLV